MFESLRPRSHRTRSTLQHHMQIMGHTVVNGSVHTGCKQHQRVCTQICTQICLRVLCEWGLRYPRWGHTFTDMDWPQSLDADGRYCFPQQRRQEQRKCSLQACCRVPTSSLTIIPKWNYIYKRKRKSVSNGNKVTPKGK